MSVGVIRREKGGRHCLSMHPFEPVTTSDDLKENVRLSLQKVAGLIEELIRQKPEQHMWMYKIWKYDQSRHALILNDGRIGHLRQSEAVVKTIKEKVEARVEEETKNLMGGLDLPPGMKLPF